jgi:hypothetical protein
MQADGGDAEARQQVTRKVTPEEAAHRAAAIARGERVVEALNSRRQGKKEMEYQVGGVGG